MAKKKSLDTARALVQGATRREAPAVNRFVPEIRSEAKYVFRRDPHLGPEKPALIVVWRYGVPQNEVFDFHVFLGAREKSIADHFNGNNNMNVKYLGTYINWDAGTPMYETSWGYMELKNNSVDQTIDIVDWHSSDFLGNPTSILAGDVRDIRQKWAADPGRSEQRFVLAATHTVEDPFLTT